ncbi:MAG: 3'-5' exonuclease [bacterium]|nr:3'-5' exonuclease [bacterium]
MQLNFDLQEKDDTPEILLNAEKEPSLLQNLPDDCVIVDIETTGLSPVNDSIIEISALKIKNGKVEEEFSSLINPKRLIPPFITKLTGISTEMVKDAEETRTVLKKFCNFIQTNPIVGHNIKFDLRFINKNLDKYFNKTLPNDYTDTLIFSRKIYTNLSSHKLTKIAEHLKISTDNAHRALNDCYMTYRIIKDMKERSSQ